MNLQYFGNEAPHMRYDDDEPSGAAVVAVVLVLYLAGVGGMLWLIVWALR